MMKKTFYYNFLPSKKEEMVAMATNRPYQVTRTLVEIRDFWEQKPAMFDLNNPWRIQKTLESHEASTGKIHLSHNDVFEHIFRYWSLESAIHVVMGNKVNIKICDVTDSNSPVMYGPDDEQVFFQKGLQDEYVLGLNMAMVRSSEFKKGNEVAIYYDPRGSVFFFKAFHDD